MRLILLLFPFIFLFSEINPPSFKAKQLNFTRVREAYAAKEKTVAKTLITNSLSRDSLQIYLRAFKTEKIIEIWAKNSSDVQFKMIKEIPICEISGNIGPKRRVGDLQVPEGFYYINDLNPFSKYYLSMQINYPNASDSIRGVRGRLGNLIFIHGACESSGCIAITDDKIKELYLYFIEACNSGQQKVELTIFPAKLEDKTFTKLTSAYGKDKDKTTLWTDLKKSYDFFEQNKFPPTVKFLKNGSHQIN
jgi:murein L,D-transpeptidase YafK